MGPFVRGKRILVKISVLNIFSQENEVFLLSKIVGTILDLKEMFLNTYYHNVTGETNG